MKLAEVISGFSADLADNEPGNEFATWTQPQLLAWWNEARCVVASLRPDKYTCQKRIKLCTGTIQKHCECTSITQVLGQVDQYGNLLNYVSKSNTAMLSRWSRRRACAPSESEADFKVTGYAVSSVGDGTFTVSPAVPDGTDAYLSVMCRVQPSDSTDPNSNVDDIDCGLMAVAKQWVLGRAYQTYDGPESFQHSNAAFTLFFKLLNLQLTTETIAKAGLTPSSVKIG
jgi:hypothetical protein